MEGNPSASQAQQFSIVGYGMGWARTSFKGHDVRPLLSNYKINAMTISPLIEDDPTCRRHSGILILRHFLP